jgi:hypothetical protein
MTDIPKPLREAKSPGLKIEDTVIVAKPTIDSWGWLPILSLTSAVGVFLEALADFAGLFEVQGADVLFWSGLIVIFLPITWRLLRPEPARRERIALLLILDIALYFVCILTHPLGFTGYDSFTHWRTAKDIVASGHLFIRNPILPASSFYPGLEIVTTVLSGFTGLSIFWSGNIVVGMTGQAFVLALYLFYERVSHSMQIAGIATLLYMANPNFLFFNSGFDYEALALSIVGFVLFILALYCCAPALQQRGLMLASWLGLGAIAMTHHVTSFALVSFLLLWSIISFLQIRSHKDQMSPCGAALIGLACIVIWTRFTGDVVIGYLTPHIRDMLSEAKGILTHKAAVRQLFLSSTGVRGPLWDRVMAPTSVALIILGLPFGIFRIWQHHRADAAALALTSGAFAYPISQALRLTNSGAESAVRANAFVFFGIAFVLAIGTTELWLSGTPGYKRSAVITSIVVIIIIGQLALSSPAWDRIPGPYLVCADDRSIEPEGIAAAQWAGTYLGPGHRIGTDRINTQLMVTYGYELIYTPVAGERTMVGPLLSSLQFDAADKDIIQVDRLQYLVVDRRLSTGLPWVGIYFDDEQKFTQPIDPAAIAKFDGIKNVDRLFDSGNIVIYDVEAISSESS